MMSSSRIRLGASVAALVLGLVVAGCSAASTPVASPATSASAPAGASAPASAPASASASAAATASAAASPSASASGAASGDAVTIQGFAFGPSSISVAVGTTVTWTNKDSVEHTVTADDGSFSSQPLPTGQSFSQTFPKAGTFAYHCKIHPSMTATITVH